MRVNRHPEAESEVRGKVQAGCMNLGATGTEGPSEVLEQLVELF